MDTQSADLQNHLQFSPEIIQTEETYSQDHPDNVPNENNREHIKSSKYRNAFLTKSQRKIGVNI